MRFIIQRVSEASVTVEDQTIGLRQVMHFSNLTVNPCISDIH